MCLIKRHAMSAHEGTKTWLHSFLRSILDGSMWLSFTPRPLYPREKSPLTCWIGGLAGLRASLDVLKDRIISFSCRESKYYSACSLNTTRTELYSYMCMCMGPSTVPEIRDRSWFDFWKQQQILLFSETSRLALGPTQPPIQCLPCTIYPGVKQAKA
jgi:hypothetical protein